MMGTKVATSTLPLFALEVKILAVLSMVPTSARFVDSNFVTNKS